MTQSTVTSDSPKTSIAFGRSGIEIHTVEDALRFCKAVAESGLAPKGLETTQKCFVALQAGLELGFSPIRALSVVVVVNGRASLMGEAALAKIRQAQICTLGPEVGTRGEGEKREGFMRFSRDSTTPIEVMFTVADAKRAGLWGKSGPWTQYPDDMLMWRSVARACKRYFSDVLLGLPLAEEVRDYPAVETTPLPSRVPQPDPLLLDAIAEAIESPAAVEPHESAASGADTGTESPGSPGAAEDETSPPPPLWTNATPSRCCECGVLRSKVASHGHLMTCSLGGDL